jgi:hypothetical protein
MSGRDTSYRGKTYSKRSARVGSTLAVRLAEMQPAIAASADKTATETSRLTGS